MIKPVTICDCHYDLVLFSYFYRCTKRFDSHSRTSPTIPFYHADVFYIWPFHVAEVLSVAKTALDWKVVGLNPVTGILDESGIKATQVWLKLPAWFFLGASSDCWTCVKLLPDLRAFPQGCSWWGRLPAEHLHPSKPRWMEERGAIEALSPAFSSWSCASRLRSLLRFKKMSFFEIGRIIYNWSLGCGNLDFTTL